MIYRIGSFNVRNLNYPVSKDGKRSFDTIATIIKNENFDVIALQEVLSDKVWEQLKMYLGTDWQFSWERPPQYFGEAKSDSRGEGYAYIWNTKKLDLIEIDVDGHTRKFLPRIWKQYRAQGQKLIREPYYARFTPKGKVGGCFCEIRLINTHIVYGDNTKTGESVRYCEFLKLVSNVYENVANKRYGDTTALANGMDVKTLSTIIGHISAETTLNIYTHITDNMQRSAANKIEQGFGRNEGSISEDKQTPDQATKTQQTAKFEPKQPKIRRPGTGCISQLGDHLFEGRYSPTNAYGKRISKNVYAKTREECEEKLAELITQMNAEITAEKERLKGEQSA